MTAQSRLSLLLILLMVIVGLGVGFTILGCVFRARIISFSSDVSTEYIMGFPFFWLSETASGYSVYDPLGLALNFIGSLVLSAILVSIIAVPILLIGHKKVIR